MTEESSALTALALPGLPPGWKLERPNPGTIRITDPQAPGPLLLFLYDQAVPMRIFFRLCLALMEMGEAVSAPESTVSASDAELQAGRDARSRAAGLGNLLDEIQARGALLLYGDDDLIERVARAVADHEATLQEVGLGAGHLDQGQGAAAP